jgi:O-antigen/teichoic acid export membrane protein
MTIYSRLQTLFTPELAERTKRFGHYSAWMVGDQAVFVGVPRLVLYPILAHILGIEAFGTFVLALGLINMIGNSPCNGLGGYTLRDAANNDTVGQQAILRTTILLAAVGALPFCLFFMVCHDYIARFYEQPLLSAFLPGLGIFLLFLNLVHTALAMSRVHRDFKRVMLTHTVFLGGMLLAVPAALAFGARSVSLAYALSGAITFTWILLHNKQAFFRRPFFSTTHAKAACRVWFPFSLSAFIALSAGHLDRVLLGVWWPGSEVAAFFAAAGTAYIFLMPGNLVSNLVQSLLGRVRSSRHFRRSFYAGYASFVCLFAVSLFAIVTLLGKPILHLLYANLAEAAAPLWDYAVGAIAALTVQVGLRPFVTKFLSLRLIPILSLAGLVARFVPLVLLVPTQGRVGAVQALLIGSVLSSSLWCVVYVRSFILSNKDHSSEIRDRRRP